MQKIMFEHRRFGLEQAVIARLKENTRRRIRFPKGINDEDVESAVMGIDQKGRVYFTFSVATDQDTDTVDVYPKYQIGEQVAVAQSYKDLWAEYLDDMDNSIYKEFVENFSGNLFSAGHDNKMFVRADLMPHVIEITDIKAERLQEISDEDCMKEGIHPYERGGYWVMGPARQFGGHLFDTPRAAFYALINSINGRGTWERNEWQFAYTFKLIK